MKAIIYGAGCDHRKWEAARLAYEDMVNSSYSDCAYEMGGDGEKIRVYAQRRKHGVTLTVQPNKI